MKLFRFSILVLGLSLCLVSCGNSSQSKPLAYDTNPVKSLRKETTLSIIKPNAVLDNNIGAIIERFETNGLKIAGTKMVQMNKQEAAAFYAIHKERPFFNDLVNFLTSSPVVVLVIEGDNAVLKNRELMGATDPSKANPGTIRADFASTMERNAVHGSDSKENAQREIAFFFTPSEIFERFE